MAVAESHGRRRLLVSATTPAFGHGSVTPGHRPLDRGGPGAGRILARINELRIPVLRLVSLRTRASGHRSPGARFLPPGRPALAVSRRHRMPDGRTPVGGHARASAGVSRGRHRRSGMVGVHPSARRGSRRRGIRRNHHQPRRTWSDSPSQDGSPQRDACR